MGLRDKIKNLDKNKFRPQYLDEATVRVLFNRCLANDSTQDHYSPRLYINDASTEIDFDRNAVLSNLKNIKYLHGQLKVVHDDIGTIDIQDVTKTYKNSTWTEDKSTIMKFIYLEIATRMLSTLNTSNNHLTVLSSDFPTLSPDDPNFEKWYAEHKSEWED